MTPESDNFETHLRALADQARATQAKKVTAVQQSDISRGQARRAVEVARERRDIMSALKSDFDDAFNCKLERELEWL